MRIDSKLEAGNILLAKCDLTDIKPEYSQIRILEMSNFKYVLPFNFEIRWSKSQLNQHGKANGGIKQKI